MTIGLLQYLVTWSTFCRHENSSLWKNDASSKLKEHIKIRWPVNLQLCNYLKSSVYNVCRKLEGFLWEKLLLSPRQGCVDAANIDYGICNANQAVTATKTAKTTTTIGLISKKQNKTKQNNFAPAAHFVCTFLCRCFARRQRETSGNFLVTRFMEEILYVVLFTFFRRRSFLP